MTDIEKAMQKRDIEAIANHFGALQFDKTIEELEELREAIEDYKESGFMSISHKEHIIEEIADVELMTEQLKYLLEGKNKAEEIKAYKIKRTLGRIKASSSQKYRTK